MSKKTCPTCGITVRRHPASSCMDVWCCSLLEPKPEEIPRDARVDPWGMIEYTSPSGFWAITCDYDTGDVPYWIPRPVSTDMAAALMVLDSWEYNWNIIGDLGKCGNTDTAVVMGERYRVILASPMMSMTGVGADSIPLAICRAEILARVAAEEEEEVKKREESLPAEPPTRGPGKLFKE